MHHAYGLRRPERNVGLAGNSTRIKVVALLNSYTVECGSDERYLCGKRKHQHVDGPLAYFESFQRTLPVFNFHAGSVRFR